MHAQMKMLRKMLIAAALLPGIAPAHAQRLPQEQGEALAKQLPIYAQWLVMVGHSIEDARACGGIVNDAEVEPLYDASAALAAKGFNVPTTETKRTLQVARNFARVAPVTPDECKSAAAFLPELRKTVARFMPVGR